MRCPRSGLHLGFVQPLQLSRRDAEGHCGLCRVGLDGRRGLRQRRAVALSHVAERAAPHAGAVGPWCARQRLALAHAARTRVPGAGARCCASSTSIWPAADSARARRRRIRSSDLRRPRRGMARRAKSWPPVSASRQFFTAPGGQLSRARPNDGDIARRIPRRLHAGQLGTDPLRTYRRHRRHDVLHRLAGTGSQAARASPRRRLPSRSRSRAIPWSRCGSPRASRCRGSRLHSISPRSRLMADKVRDDSKACCAPSIAPRRRRPPLPDERPRRSAPSPARTRGRCRSASPQLLEFARCRPRLALFPAGSRIRLSISGGHAEHFVADAARPPAAAHPPERRRAGERAGVANFARGLFSMIFFQCRPTDHARWNCRYSCRGRARGRLAGKEDDLGFALPGGRADDGFARPLAAQITGRSARRRGRQRAARAARSGPPRSRVRRPTATR